MRVGKFEFDNIPFNNYHLTASASGFQSGTQNIDVRSPVPVELKIDLQVGSAKTVVTVTDAQDLVENDPVNHTDVDRTLFNKTQ
jgi:hypothetical protein